MKPRFLGSVAAIAVAVSATVVFPTIAAEQTPPMGGGYTNVIPIPVNDPEIKAIAGALFKPAGGGPFPAVIYMSGCAGLGPPPEKPQEKAVIDHLLSKGVATLIVDPFTPCSEPEGVCANLNDKTVGQYFTRGGNDALAAANVLKAMPDIDTKPSSCRAIPSGRFPRSTRSTRKIRQVTTPKSRGLSRTILIATTASIHRFPFSS
jgi:hypothetical protein